MKIYCRPNQLHSYKQYVNCGVSVTPENEIRFNWQEDTPNDIIHLTSSSSGRYEDDGVRYFYAYQFLPQSSSRDRKLFRDSMKGKYGTDFLFREDVEEFIDTGLDELDSFSRIEGYSFLVHIDSTAESLSAIDVIQNRLTQFDVQGVDLSLIKKMYKDVQFDKEKAYQILLDHGYSVSKADKEIKFLLDKFETLKNSETLFQMKRFLPAFIRSAFYDYLQFKTEEERELYEAFQGVDVLIYDDFLTSGATVKEVIRLLRSIHEMNRLTVFVLIKQ